MRPVAVGAVQCLVPVAPAMLRPQPTSITSGELEVVRELPHDEAAESITHLPEPSKPKEVAFTAVWGRIRRQLATRRNSTARTRRFLIS